MLIIVTLSSMKPSTKFLSAAESFENGSILVRSRVEGGNVKAILEKYGKNNLEQYLWSHWPVIGKVERPRNFGQLPRLLVYNTTMCWQRSITVWIKCCQKSSLVLMLPPFSTCICSFLPIFMARCVIDDSILGII